MSFAAGAFSTGVRGGDAQRRQFSGGKQSGQPQPQGHFHHNFHHGQAGGVVGGGPGGGGGGQPDPATPGATPGGIGVSGAPPGPPPPLRHQPTILDLARRGSLARAARGLLGGGTAEVDGKAATAASTDQQLTAVGLDG